MQRGGIWVKGGRFVVFPRALSACIWGDTALKSYFLLAFGVRKKGFENDTFHAVFPQHLGILGPPNTVKERKTQNDKSTLLYPPPRAQGGGLSRTAWVAPQVA